MIMLELNIGSTVCLSPGISTVASEPMITHARTKPTRRLTCTDQAGSSQGFDSTWESTPIASQIGGSHSEPTETGPTIEAVPGSDLSELADESGVPKSTKVGTEVGGLCRGESRKTRERRQTKRHICDTLS